jgi:hypothetical protein
MFDERVLAGVHIGELFSRDAGGGGRGGGGTARGWSCASWRLGFDKVDYMFMSDTCYMDDCRQNDGKNEEKWGRAVTN